MTKEQATATVDAWVNEWRLYLNGGLHWKARAALIEAMTATETPKTRTKAKQAPAEAKGA